ncbi:putative 2-dehydro-3-deoxy-D-gluconate 5-dehydrogenase @ 2-deoxy-D-gluconate 3-dehydrogenase [Burkholderia sp. IT-111MI5]
MQYGARRGDGRRARVGRLRHRRRESLGAGCYVGACRSGGAAFRRRARGFVDAGAGRADRRRRGRCVRPGRHPRQQRRHDPPPRCARFHRGGLGRRRRREPEERVLPVAVGGAADGAAGARRQDREHRVDAVVPGRHPRAVVHGVEERRAGPHAAARERMGRARDQRERDRPRLHGDRQHRAAARGQPAQRRNPRPHPGRPLGRARRSRGRGRVPRVACIGLRARPHARRRRRVARTLTVLRGGRVMLSRFASTDSRT